MSQFFAITELIPSFSEVSGQALTERGLIVALIVLIILRISLGLISKVLLLGIVILIAMVSFHYFGEFF